MKAQSAGAFFEHCAVLGLRSVSTVEELKSAYRPLILRWHPDRHHGSADHVAALERAKAINASYEYLSEVLEAGLVPPATQASSHSSHESWRATTDAYRTRRTYKRQEYREGFPDESVLEIFVKSSNIISVGYSSATSVLYLKFQGNRVYRYFGVPSKVFEDLLAAPSHGKFANAHIISRYKYEPC